MDMMHTLFEEANLTPAEQAQSRLVDAVIELAKGLPPGYRGSLLAHRKAMGRIPAQEELAAEKIRDDALEMGEASK